MLLSLLLSALAAPSAISPAQEAPARAIDALPHDTLLVLELSLEPWDRGRLGTRAHEILRGKNLLRSTMEADFDTEQELENFRGAIGSVRVSVALTPGSLLQETAFVIVEPLNPGAASVDWNELLIEAFGIEPARWGSSYISALIDTDYDDLEASAAWLAEGVAAMKEEGKKLGDDPRWRALHASLATPDDLFRATVPGWNWNAATFNILTEAMGDEPLGEMPGFDEILEMFGLNRGVIWTTSIRGADVVDRMLLPRDPEEESLLMPVGDAETVLAELGEMRVGLSAVSVQGYDFSRLADIVQKGVGLVMQSEPGAEDPLLDPVFQSITTMMREMGPRLTTIGSLDALAQDQPSNYRIQVGDRDKLIAAWESLPEEFLNIIPFVVMQLGGNPNPVSWAEGELRLDFNTIESDEQPALSETQGFAIAEAAILEAVAGREIYNLQIMPAEFDRTWLGDRAGLFELVEVFFESGRTDTVIEQERLDLLQPNWLIGVRTERGFEFEARSTFGYLVSAGLAGAATALMQAEEDEDAFDAEEF